MSESEPLRFRVHRTKNDYWSAVLLNTVRSPWTYVLLAVGPTINASITFFGARTDGVEQQIAATAGIAAITVVAATVLLLLCLWLGAFMSWRAPGALEPIDFEFDEAGMYARSAVGEGKSSWIIFSAMVEGAKLLLLRQRPGLLHVFPKRDLSPEQLGRLRTLIQAHVNKSRSAA